MAKEPNDKKTSNKFTSFSDEERAAMKEAVKERNQENGEAAVLAKIAEMPEPGRTIAKRLHEIVTKNAPNLTPKTWYGMPAYANKEGKVVCFFQDKNKFKYPYHTLGFNDGAHLADGNMWPIAFAIVDLSALEEKRIAELIIKAAS